VRSSGIPTVVPSWRWWSLADSSKEAFIRDNWLDEVNLKHLRQWVESWRFSTTILSENVVKHPASYPAMNDTVPAQMKGSEGKLQDDCISVSFFPSTPTHIQHAWSIELWSSGRNLIKFDLAIESYFLVLFQNQRGVPFNGILRTLFVRRCFSSGDFWV